MLTGPARPIVLLRRRAASPLTRPGGARVTRTSASFAVHTSAPPSVPAVPGSEVRVPAVLVVTSGNLSDEPICYEDDDARARLGRFVDAWLVHDRPIHVPCDDSVVRVERGQELPIRRSRGYAPLPVRFAIRLRPVGGGRRGAEEHVLPGVGPRRLDEPAHRRHGQCPDPRRLRASVGQFAEMYRVDPRLVAADSHPGYQTRRWAEDETDWPVALVQHHHAHIAAVMVENAVPVDERVIGFAFDGTGYGPDGPSGGARYSSPVTTASIGSRICATSRCRAATPVSTSPTGPRWLTYGPAGIEWSADLAPVTIVSPVELSVLRRQLERNVHCVPTSSMGRLFDAVSSLLGVRHTVSYEAQAAIELETLAGSFYARRSYARQSEIPFRDKGR